MKNAMLQQSKVPFRCATASLHKFAEVAREARKRINFCLENPAGEGGGVGVQHFADRYTDCKAWKPRLLESSGHPGFRLLVAMLPFFQFRKPT